MNDLCNHWEFFLSYMNFLMLASCISLNRWLGCGLLIVYLTLTISHSYRILASTRHLVILCNESYGIWLECILIHAKYHNSYVLWVWIHIESSTNSSCKLERRRYFYLEELPRMLLKKSIILKFIKENTNKFYTSIGKRNVTIILLKILVGIIRLDYVYMQQDFEEIHSKLIITSGL